MLGAEADPFVKVGGLGDVTGSLPGALLSLPDDEIGNTHFDVRLAIPFHPPIKEKIYNPVLVDQFTLQRGDDLISGKTYQVEKNGVPIYLVDGPPIAADPNIYSIDTAKDGERYTFFSLGVLETIRHIGWQPDIIHAHDWHTAMAIYWLSLHRAGDPFYKKVRTLITVHNLPFMGGGTSESLTRYGLPPTDDPRLPEWARHFPLPLGLLTAERITTVSPTYACEILTEEYGSGLKTFLAKRKHLITGILNGLDQDLWNPATDSAIASPFTSNSLELRQVNKRALLAEMGLRMDTNLPLLIFIGRMDPQKGIDVAIEALRSSIDLPWQAVFLGSGIPELQEATQKFADQYPDRVKAIIRFDGGLARRMYAAGDMILMPSRYEPCGLAQMIAMRYGCLPVASATGGLKDSIVDEAKPGSGNTGFLFQPTATPALEAAIRRAITCCQEPSLWTKMQENAMKQDFSWSRSANAYAKLYQEMMKVSIPRVSTRGKHES
jgi:starch synthase